MKLIQIFLFLFLFSTQIFTQNNLLENLLKSNPQDFKHLIDSLEKYQIQIVFSQINRDESNFPHFTTHTFNVDENRYFYPASTVKMPTAFMALEKINDLKIIGLDKYANMQTGAGQAPQIRVTVDTSAKNLIPSVANYVKKIFIVSDNEAQNRLYEFVGQEDLNEGLRKKGFTKTRIIHRLGASDYDFEANQLTNPVSFYGNDGLLYHQGEVKSSGFPEDWKLENEICGLGYLNNENELINEPFNFRKKNFLSLPVLHDLMKTVIFPEAVPAEQRFNFTEEDYQFLYQVMSELPQESEYPNYGNKADNYCKFFIFGEEKEDFKIPENIRIFNKVGWAYGFLSDVSYVVDFENKVEFLVAAVIHVNENQIYNDGNYEYETIGLPFFAKLGKALYELELKREKEFLPDLSRYKIEKYD